jgi:hypothetical protein
MKPLPLLTPPPAAVCQVEGMQRAALTRRGGAMNMTVEADKGHVTDLSLTAQERDELRLALETCVNDLHNEIAHTDRYEFRQELKVRRVLLHRVLQQLGGAPTAAAR